MATHEYEMQFEYKPIARNDGRVEAWPPQYFRATQDAAGRIAARYCLEHDLTLRALYRLVPVLDFRTAPDGGEEM